MQYVYRLTIPANTTKASPSTQECPLTYGVITHVAVAFPPGPLGFAHLVVNRFEHQLWPTNSDESFAWDDYTIEFDADFALDTRPFALTLVGWNEDDTEPHTITVRFNVERERYTLEDLLAMRQSVDVVEA